MPRRFLAFTAVLSVATSGVATAQIDRSAPRICRGNEPFWNLEIAEGRATLDAVVFAQANTYDGYSVDMPWLVPAVTVWRGYDSADRAIVAVIRTEACLDSMADRPPYPESVLISLPQGTVFTGCCEPLGSD